VYIGNLFIQFIQVFLPLDLPDQKYKNNQHHRNAYADADADDDTCVLPLVLFGGY